MKNILIVAAFMLYTCTLSGSQLGFKSPEYSYQALRALAATSGGGADIGECLETMSHIIEGDDESWYREWHTLAERVEKEAARSKKAGHYESAKGAYLRASNYYRTAEFFLRSTPNDPKAIAAWKKSKSCFLEAITDLAHPVTQVKIPFEGTFLPGYFCQGEKNKPLLILQTGFDGTAEELYITHAQAAIKRSYNCLIFEGPGQGAVIREQGIPFRANWETVITPVVDFALQLPEVDPKRIALMGISFGGYFVPRALAFEKRIKVGIANGGIYDFHQVCMPKEETHLEQLLDDPEAARQIDAEILQRTKSDSSLRWFFGNGMFTFGAKTPTEWLKMTRSYTLEPVIKQITCPMLLVDSEGETHLKGQSKKVYDSLVYQKEYLLFLTQEGAGAHCQVGAYSLSNERIFNWLDTHL